MVIERSYLYPDIIKGLNQAEEALKALLKYARMLDVEVDAASYELRNVMVEKDIQALKDLSNAIVNAANPGVELICKLANKEQRNWCGNCDIQKNRRENNGY